MSTHGYVLVWVLTLVTPGDMPNVAIAAPVLTLEECDKLGEHTVAPFPTMCFPQEISWDDLA